jgi:hypothetical protein
MSEVQNNAALALVKYRLIFSQEIVIGTDFWGADI